MIRHYSYRMDHDLGFAPHIAHGLCSVCGCKATTVERWVTPGSWVVGIGGQGTGKPDKLIYAMKVKENPSYSVFKKRYPRVASYLSHHSISASAPVLLSRHFFYFGDHARSLPPKLSHIVQATQGCKRLSDDDIALLQSLVLKNTQPGIHGRPNNGTAAPQCEPSCRQSREETESRLLKRLNC